MTELICPRYPGLAMYCCVELCDTMPKSCPSWEFDTFGSVSGKPRNLPDTIQSHFSSTVGHLRPCQCEPLYSLSLCVALLDRSQPNHHPRNLRGAPLYVCDHRNPQRGMVRPSLRLDQCRPRSSRTEVSAAQNHLRRLLCSDRDRPGRPPGSVILGRLDCTQCIVVPFQPVHSEGHQLQRKARRDGRHLRQKRSVQLRQNRVTLSALRFALIFLCGFNSTRRRIWPSRAAAGHRRSDWVG